MPLPRDNLACKRDYRHMQCLTRAVGVTNQPSVRWVLVIETADGIAPPPVMGETETCAATCAERWLHCNTQPWLGGCDGVWGVGCDGEEVWDGLWLGGCHVMIVCSRGSPHVTATECVRSEVARPQKSTRHKKC